MANYRRIQSGGHIAAKRMTACEICNFMELYNSKGKLRTGSYCPRCNQQSIRVYDSKAEFTRAQELKIMRDEGLITELEFQPRFPLHAPCASSSTELDKKHLYDFVADFAYSKDNVYVVEDVKGASRGKAIITDVAQMKIKHFEAEYEVPVTIVLR